MKHKAETSTHKILTVLREADDFLSRPMIREKTGCNCNQVSAALHNLRGYRCVDVIIQPDGVGWWYALPPELDTRTSEVVERAPETKPRSRKKGLTTKQLFKKVMNNS